MQIITLTTDYGLRDPYAAKLKGVLLSACPNAQIVDISHQINPYDIVEAAYFMGNAAPGFPQGSIHICMVKGDRAGMDLPFVAFQQNKQSYILPDNGLVSLLFPKFKGKIVRLGLDHEPLSIQEDGSAALHNGQAIKSQSSTRHIIAQAVRKLGLGYDIRHLGPFVEDAYLVTAPHPVLHPDGIRASILHIDRFDNVILNVDRQLIDQIAKGRRVKILCPNAEPIIGIVEHYHDVPPEQLLARYTDEGRVEVAINMGRAAQLFGLGPDQLVILEFD